MDNTNDITKRKPTYKPLSELNLCDDFTDLTPFTS
jgi:hypothetical protein